MIETGVNVQVLERPSINSNSTNDKDSFAELSAPGIRSDLKIFSPESVTEIKPDSLSNLTFSSPLRTIEKGRNLEQSVDEAVGQEGTFVSKALTWLSDSYTSIALIHSIPFGLIGAGIGFAVGGPPVAAAGYGFGTVCGVSAYCLRATFAGILGALDRSLGGI